MGPHPHAICEHPREYERDLFTVVARERLAATADNRRPRVEIPVAIRRGAASAMRLILSGFGPLPRRRTWSHS